MVFKHLKMYAGNGEVRIHPEEVRVIHHKRAPTGEGNKYLDVTEMVLMNGEKYAVIGRLDLNLEELPPS